MKLAENSGFDISESELIPTLFNVLEYSEL
jgi:hypothetical protein